MQECIHDPVQPLDMAGQHKHRTRAALEHTPPSAPNTLQSCTHRLFDSASVLACRLGPRTIPFEDQHRGRPSPSHYVLIDWAAPQRRNVGLPKTTPEVQKPTKTRVICIYLPGSDRDASRSGSRLA